MSFFNRLSLVTLVFLANAPAFFGVAHGAAGEDQAVTSAKDVPDFGKGIWRRAYEQAGSVLGGVGELRDEVLNALSSDNQIVLKMLTTKLFIENINTDKARDIIEARRFSDLDFAPSLSGYHPKELSSLNDLDWDVKMAILKVNEIIGRLTDGGFLEIEAVRNDEGAQHPFSLNIKRGKVDTALFLEQLLAPTQLKLSRKNAEAYLSWIMILGQVISNRIMSPERIAQLQEEMNNGEAVKAIGIRDVLEVKMGNLNIPHSDGLFVSEVGVVMNALVNHAKRQFDLAVALEGVQERLGDRAQGSAAKYQVKMAQMKLHVSAAMERAKASRALADSLSQELVEAQKRAKAAFDAAGKALREATEAEATMDAEKKGYSQSKIAATMKGFMQRRKFKKERDSQRASEDEAEKAAAEEEARLERELAEAKRKREEAAAARKTMKK